MFRSILIAVDGSSSSGRALQEAVDIARAQGARLTILTVAPPVPTLMPVAGGDPRGIQDGAERWAAGVLRDALAGVPGGLDVHTVLRTGHPSDEVVDELRDGDYDLVVLGSRGRSATRAGILGSVNGAVHFHAGVPMLSFPTEDERPSSG
jgi:nucleotide-binding universal stress UspA family protein